MSWLSVSMRTRSSAATASSANPLVRRASSYAIFGSGSGGCGGLGSGVGAGGGIGLVSGG